MIFFGNLFFHFRDDKQVSFLFNLISFRRKILTSSERDLICSMMKKNATIQLFGEKEIEFYEELKKKKQIFCEKDEQRIHDYYAQHYMRFRKKTHTYDTEQNITIQVTQKCNMNCTYCYCHEGIEGKETISIEQIDYIAQYYEFLSQKLKVNINISSVTFTGGEPLLDEDTVSLINYSVKKWPEAKLYIMTNGLNLMKFYSLLPLNQTEMVQVSLDGVMRIHMERRFSKPVANSNYDLIIKGIQKLLVNKKKVRIAITLDRENYKHIMEFIQFLKRENIVGNPNLELKFSAVADFSSELEFDPEHNTLDEVFEIAEYMKVNLGVQVTSFFPALGHLIQYLFREDTSFKPPYLQKCLARSFNQLNFSPNGNVYLCICTDEKKGLMGTYFPQMVLHEEALRRVANYNPIFDNVKCRVCIFKYVCLGGCPVYAEAQNKKTVCSIFGQEEILEKILYLALV